MKTAKETYENILERYSQKYVELSKEYEKARKLHIATGILCVVYVTISVICFVVLLSKPDSEEISDTSTTIEEAPVVNSVSDTALLSFLQDNGAWYPDILLAQAKLETGHFKSGLCVNNNNLFGMSKAYKRKHTQSGHTNNFATYDTWMESALDRILWDNYHFQTPPSRTEYLSFLKNYAEDTMYVDKLVSML